MRTRRLRGFEIGALSTNYGHTKIHVVGTGSHHASPASLYINDVEIVSIDENTDGLTIIELSGDHAYIKHNTYDVKNADQVDAFSTRLSAIGADNFYVIMSHGQNSDSVELSNVFGSVGSYLWAKGKETYLFNASTHGFDYAGTVPYCAMGNKVLGIAHETYGSSDFSNENPNAILEILLGDYLYFGINGFGPERLEIFQYEHTNTTIANVDVYALDTTKLLSNQYMQADLNSKIAGGISTIDIKENGITVETIVLNSNVYVSQTMSFLVDITKTYTIYINTPTDSELKITSLSIKTVGQTPKYANNGNVNIITNGTLMKYNAVNEYMVALDFKESRNTVVIGSEDSHNTAFADGLAPYTLPDTMPLYSSQAPSVTFTGTLDSGLIGVDGLAEINPHIDYVFSTWFHSPVAQNITIALTAYDASDNIIESGVYDYTGNNRRSSVIMNEVSIGANETGYEECYILSRFAADQSLFALQKTKPYGHIDSGGHGLTGTVNSVTSVRMNPLTHSIRIVITSESNLTVISPFISQLKYGFKNNGTIVGSIFENND